MKFPKLFRVFKLFWSFSLKINVKKLMKLRLISIDVQYFMIKYDSLRLKKVSSRLIYQSLESITYFCSSSILSLFNLVLILFIDKKNILINFFFVKSWGKNWGQNGYGQVARNQNNMLNISTDASYALVV